MFDKRLACCPLTLLEQHCGIKFGLDLDGSVLIEAKPGFESIAESLRPYEDHIRWHILLREKNRRRQCVGGPMNGQKHDGRKMKPLLFHMERGKWAVYEVKSYTDLRAFFVGYAKSQAKARRLWAMRREDRTANTD